MSELEERLGTILNNPQMMQQIMAMAQAMNQTSPPEPPKESPPKLPDAPSTQLAELDLGMLQKLSGFARQSGVDKNQRDLLNALSPYLSRGRVAKLEKAMRAAKMAGMASTLLNSGALQNLIGR